MNNHHTFSAAVLIIRLNPDAADGDMGGLAAPGDAAQTGEWHPDAGDPTLSLLAQRHPAWVLVPASDCAFHRVTLPAGARRNAQQALAFLLEEQLATEIEESHFALIHRDKSDCAVAVVGREKMRAWQAWCEGLGLNVLALTPDALARRRTRPAGAPYAAANSGCFAARRAAVWRWKPHGSANCWFTGLTSRPSPATHRRRISPRRGSLARRRICWRWRRATRRRAKSAYARAILPRNAGRRRPDAGGRRLSQPWRYCCCGAEIASTTISPWRVRPTPPCRPAVIFTASGSKRKKISSIHACKCSSICAVWKA